VIFKEMGKEKRALPSSDGWKDETPGGEAKEKVELG